MDLRDVQEAIVPLIHERMYFLTAGYSMVESGDALESLSELFQALGVCHLLTGLNVDEFRQNLVRAGHARRYFLRKSKGEGNVSDRHLALSRCEAFLAAVAAGDLRLARDIAILSSETWNKNWEYEDDFCYFLFLHKTVKHPTALATQDLRLILEQFEQALEGAASTRLEVCKALGSQDEEVFNVALGNLLAERQEQLDEKRSSVMDMDIESLLFWPNSFVSIEGLALLKIAELRGLQPDAGFPLCQEEARLSITDNQYVDLFVELEQALAADREEPS